jgi:hypothetical protein
MKSTMRPSCDDWLFSDFFKERDGTTLPIFENDGMIVFADGWQSCEEIHRIAKWNCLNKQLLAVTTDIRDVEQAIQFLQKWFIRSSDPKSHNLDATRDGYITPGNDVSKKDLQVVLQKREARLHITS